MASPATIGPRTSLPSPGPDPGEARRCAAADSRLLPKVASLGKRGIRVLIGSAALTDDRIYDRVVLSPGIDPSVPLVQKYVEGGVEIVGELELAFETCACPVIAITGTNGKTTTASMLGEILECAYASVGNARRLELGHDRLSRVRAKRSCNDLVQLFAMRHTAAIADEPRIGCDTGLVQLTDALALRSGADLTDDAPASRGELVRSAVVLNGSVRLRDPDGFERLFEGGERHGPGLLRWREAGPYQRAAATAPRPVSG